MKEVWYVVGDPHQQGVMPTLFQTKEDAERYARLCFPDEDPYKRYCRVYFKEVLAYEHD